MFSVCSNSGIDRPAVRAAVGLSQSLVDPLDHLVRERVPELVGVHVGLGCRVAHEVGEEALDDPVLAHDLLRPLGPRGGEDRLLLLATLDETLGLEPLEHLTRRRARDAEHLRHACCDRGRTRRGPVLADREGEEVDGLEIVVDRMPVCLRHRVSLERPGRGEGRTSFVRCSLHEL